MEFPAFVCPHLHSLSCLSFTIHQVPPPSTTDLQVLSPPIQALRVIPQSTIQNPPHLYINLDCPMVCSLMFMCVLMFGCILMFLYSPMPSCSTHAPVLMPSYTCPLFLISWSACCSCVELTVTRLHSLKSCVSWFCLCTACLVLY